MHPTRLITPLVLTAMLAIMTTTVAADETGKSHATIKAVAVTDFVAANEDAVILDVRTAMEYDISHVPGAVNINVQDQSFTELVSKLDSDKTYIVYCTKNPVDGRSMAALGKMKELGFKDLISLEGGHVAWGEAQLPMSVKEDP